MGTKCKLVWHTLCSFDTLCMFDTHHVISSILKNKNIFIKSGYQILWIWISCLIHLLFTFVKKTEGNLFGKVLEIIEECFENWQTILSQFIRKPMKNHRKRIEISTRSWWSWSPAGSEIQLKVLRKPKETSLAKWLKFLRNALKVGRRFSHNSYENLRKTMGNKLKSQQDRGEVAILLEAKFNWKS